MLQTMRHFLRLKGKHLCLKTVLVLCISNANITVISGLTSLTQGAHSVYGP